MFSQRRSHFDVTNSVWIADPRSVAEATCAILERLYPAQDLRPVRRAFLQFGDIYAGEHADYVGNETWFHDAQHSLDTALAMARLVDGYERQAPVSGRLGATRACVGVVTALFHDVGYVRRHSDRERHGAELTVCHVRRGAAFLGDYMPELGYGEHAGLAAQMIHLTGYEMPLERIALGNPLDHRLGVLLGTADLTAQLADRCHLEKCRDFLYAEYEICGLAGPRKPAGPVPLFSSPEDLLRKAPAVLERLWQERLDGHFERSYRFFETHFRGTNPYLTTIRTQMARLVEALEADRLDSLQRRPLAINAPRLRGILGLERCVRVPTPRTALGLPHLALRVSMAENRRLLPT